MYIYIYVYLSVYIYIVKRRTSTEVIVVLVHRLIANAHIHRATLKSNYEMFMLIIMVQNRFM